MDEEENVEIVSVDEVENEIMQINDEIEELKSSENISCLDTEEDETVDTDILKQQEGGTYLFLLAKKLLNFQASTNFVERFFSICGIICNVKNTNMSDKMIIMRSVLKTNIEILESLAIEELE